MSTTKNFKICQKLNYATETDAKRKNVDIVSAHIKEQMIKFGFVEASPKSKVVDYVFSIGGDGTMMHSMRHHLYKGSLVVGINAGNVGFLTPYSLDDILNSDVVSLLENSPRIEKRSLLSHDFKNKKGYAVNDYAITTPSPNGMLDFSIEIEHRGQINKAGRYRANALVVSGPCGSTAYNMNAGGSIVDPVVKCIQLVMIAPTTLGARPLIISKYSTIYVHLHNDGEIYSDGMLEHKIKKDETLKINLLARESNILVPQDWNFFNVLSEKLHWNNGQSV
jgi:NAD+ kinase